MRDFTQWEVIGKGRERTCYQDPEDKSRCIKVSRKSNAKQSLKEIKYFSLLNKKSCPFTHIPKMYQVIEQADLIGVEQEVILDDSGSISKTLHFYIVEERTYAEMDAFYEQLAIFRDYLIENHIIPSDLVMSNLLVRQKNDELRIYMIDGFGAAEFIPLSNYIPWLGRRKIERKWEQFMSKLLNPSVKTYQKDFYTRYIET
ncbi:YrbL family protein [Vibrio clamense]|uniref:YrbL family protein n=1 Tax=Vibrio TaxID=662 RepID=UPI0014935055|nr:YrbL family protein [Vibrio sp. 03-59-1]NOH84745.1 hypothetical protein [Vibrio sp. 03-59-1]